MTTRTPNAAESVGQLVAERPELARTFEQLGIDYCCGGRRTLAEACAQRGLDLEHVRTVLNAAVRTAPAAGPDWTTAPLAQLAYHIESTHHRLMRLELPRAAALVLKVAGAHGRNHPELEELKRTFESFADELMDHMDREEAVLFPWIRALAAGRTREGAGDAPLIEPVRRMMQEHDRAGDSLRKMSELTRGFTAPPDACGTYRVMLSELREIELDMHIHVHKENNALFPRALALTSSCRERS